VILPPDAIAQVVAMFTQNPDAAAVFGSYDDAPPVEHFFSQYKNLFHHYVHQHAREEAAMFWSICGAIRRSAFFAVGGFDERYRESYAEGVELSCRLRKAGYKIQLCKALQVKNLRQWQVKSFVKKDFFLRVLPWTELLLRHHHFHHVGLSGSGKASVLLTHGIWGALLGAGWVEGLLAVAGGLFLTLLVINFPLYYFFLKKRGWRFANRAIVWQVLYYGYCAIAFLMGIVLFWWKKPQPAPTSLVLVPEGRPDAVRRPEWR